jgi:hypothetical protein
MSNLLEQARAEPDGLSGPAGPDWSVAAAAARRQVVRTSLELRLVVSIVS